MLVGLLPALRAACRPQQALRHRDAYAVELHANCIAQAVRPLVLGSHAFYFSSSPSPHMHGGLNYSEFQMKGQKEISAGSRPALQATRKHYQETCSGKNSTMEASLVSTIWNKARVHMSNPWGASPGREKGFASQPVAEVTLERLKGPDDGIVVVSLNRPERKNAVGKIFLSQLQEAIEAIDSDPSTRVVIVQSEVEGVFCAGADLKERRTQTAAEVQQFVRSLRGTFADLEALQIPSIAAIEGKALGGGCEFALSCDLRIAGEKAAFGLPETGLAIIPGAGATQRLPRVIGKPLAKELIFTGGQISAEKAEMIGLANHCVPAGEAFSKALELARQILTRGPMAIRMAKAAIDRGAEVDLTTGLAIEEACYARLLPTKDRLEALEAFKEKRKPIFRGE